MQLATEGRADDLREELRQRALGSLYFFAKRVLHYEDLTPTFHEPFCHDIQSTIHIRRRGYLMPRGHFKSTVISKTYPLWRLCGGGNKDPLRDCRNLRFLIIGESEKVAAKNLKDIKNNILTNQVLQWLFPEVAPPGFDVRATKWTDTEILLPRSKSFDEPSITTMGVGQKGTGFHYDVIIYDDPIGEKASNSEPEMAGAIEWFQYACGLQNDPATCEELMAGTRWKAGRADLYGYIMDEMPLEKASEDRPTGFRWYIRSCYVKDKDGNDTPAFPERFTMETLADIRKREKTYKFSCQYVNDPTTPEGVDFPENLIQYYDIATDHEGRPTIIRTEGQKDVRLRDLFRVAFYDPSPGGASATCESAITVLGMASDKRVFVLDSWAMNTGYDGGIEKWHLLNDQFVCHSNCYEWVGAQKEVENLIALRYLLPVCPKCGGKHRRFNPEGIKPPGGSADKDARIRSFAQATFEQKRIYFRRNSGQQQQLIIQITCFPHYHLKDRFDSLAYGISRLRAPTDEDVIKMNQEREEERRATINQRTQCEHQYGGYA